MKLSTKEYIGLGHVPVGVGAMITVELSVSSHYLVI